MISSSSRRTFQDGPYWKLYAFQVPAPAPDLTPATAADVDKAAPDADAEATPPPPPPPPAWKTCAIYLEEMADGDWR